MPNYYCDLAGDYTDVSGLTAAKISGPGGFQALLDGTGNAAGGASPVAGDIIYLKGTALLTRLVKLTIADTTSWLITHEVRNATGAGDDWTGVICKIIDGTNMLVELDAADDEDDINIADNVENTTIADTETCSVKSCPGIVSPSIDIVVASVFKVIGVKDDWSIATGGAGNSTDYQAVLDGGGDAKYCFSTVGNCDSWRFENITMKNATSYGFYSSLYYNYYWNIVHCSIENNGSHGTSVYRMSYILLEMCIFKNNNNHGYYNGYYNGNAFINCVAYGNGEAGFNPSYASSSLVMINCLAYENSAEGFKPAGTDGSFFFNCASDSNTYGIRVDAGREPNIIRFCRLTNNSIWGIGIGTDQKCDSEDYNVFYNNGAGDPGGSHRNNIDAGPHSVVATSAGYVDAAGDDYNVASGKELRSEGIVLDWS